METNKTMQEQAGVSPVFSRTAEPKIGAQDIRRARTILEKYKQGKVNLENRIIENEKWFRLRHWETFETKDNTRRCPASAWLFNALANKHADAMDNYPDPSVLPRAADDEMAAGMLSDILPVVLDRNNYEQVYNDAWWYKLRTGTAVKGVFWDSRKLNGLGDIDIQLVDVLNLYWEPGVEDIQDSQNLFCLSLVDREQLQKAYPDIQINAGDTTEVKQYQYDDTVDTTDKVVVVDWYYKVNTNGKNILHYCKFVNDAVLYASENVPEYAERGYYDHGKYPYVFDVLFPVAGSPCGFGQIDVNRDAQEQIDKLNQAIVENAIVSAKKRYLVSGASGINEEELMDITKDVVHVDTFSENSFRELSVDPLPATCLNVINNKIEELKETSGNRDFSQGGTSSGVTAASAIAALMEAGSKLSRDSIKSAYRAFTGECYLVVELIRQFYDEPRKFRITGKNNQTEFVEFDNSVLRSRTAVEYGAENTYMPVFDIQVVPQKKSPFSKVSQNELAKEFFQMGFFNPQLSDQALACIDMMDFDGKDQVIMNIQQNGTLYQQLVMMQQQMAKMAAVIDSQNGTSLLANMGEGGAVRAEEGKAPERAQNQSEQMQKRARGAAEPA